MSQTLQNTNRIYLVKPHPPEEILHQKTPIPEDYKYNWEPLVLKLAAYYLNKEGDGGMIPRIWHLFDKSDDSLFLEAFASEQPRFLVFTEIDILIPEINRLSRLCRAKNPDCTIIICGKHSSLLRAGDTIPFENADYILGGDALKTLPKLIKQIPAKTEKGTEEIPSHPEIPGAVIFEHQKRIVLTVTAHSERTDFSDLDGTVLRQIPVANHSMEEYRSRQIHPALMKGEIKTAPIFIGTGCPYRCSVCQSPIEYGKSSQKICLRSPESISEEIIFLMKEHGFNSFFSLEPNMNLRNLEKIYQCLSEAGITLPAMSGFVRAADVCHAGRTGLLRPLAAAGMRVLSIGLDIPMDSRSDKYNKQYSYGEMMECLQLCREAGILVLGTIVCDPEMTENQLESLLEKVADLTAAAIDVRLAIPLRNTSYFKEVEASLIHHPEEGEAYFFRQNYRYQTIRFPGKIAPRETYSLVNRFLTHFLTGRTHIDYVCEIVKNHPDTIPFFRKQYGSVLNTLREEDYRRLSLLLQLRKEQPQQLPAPTHYDRVAELYDAAFSDITVRQAEIRWLENRLPEKPFSLLELGCGGGALLHHLRKRISHGTGLDTSREMIGIARNRNKNSGHIRFFCVKGGAFPDFEEKRFDLIISLLSWRYLDWNQLWPNLLKVLSPGGRILVVDVARSPGDLRDFLPALSDRFKILFSSRDKHFKANLKKLIENRDWKTMLSAHPMRPLEDYRNFFRDHAPGTSIHILNRTMKSKVVGFDTEPLFPSEFGRVALLDWGIGGLGLFSLIKKEYPESAIGYFSDSGFTPYGKCSSSQLSRRLEEILVFLADRGVTHLAVACNAMSTMLEASLKVPDGVSLCGVIRPTVEKLKKEPSMHLGVIGGNRTIDSKSYEALLAPIHKVTQNSAQPLSALIEKGGEDRDGIEQVIREVTAPLKECSALVLGCTHYPAALSAFEAILPGMRFIDPSEITYSAISSWPFLSEGKEDIFLTTGDPREMRLAAKRVFGQEIGIIHPLNKDLGIADPQGGCMP